MAWRFRCNLRFTPGSGYGQWSLDQNSQRLSMAYHLNPDTLYEERSFHQADGDEYRADLFFTDEALALDTWSTFNAPAVLATVEADEDELMSFIDVHECMHDVGGPCTNITQRWERGSEAVAPGTLEPWQAWDGHPDSLYQIGDEVSHNGHHWKATVGNNHWEPGEYGWEDLGPLP